MRAASLLAGRVRLLALTSSPQRCGALRTRRHHTLGGQPGRCGPACAARLAWPSWCCTWLLRPPTKARPGYRPRTRALVRVLSRRARPQPGLWLHQRVYGDCGGDWVNENPRCAAPPPAPRAVCMPNLGAGLRTAHRRGLHGAAHSWHLRARPGGTPRDRLLRGTPITPCR